MATALTVSPIVKDNNLETFSLVWLDVSVDDPEKNMNVQQQLRAFINCLKIFEHCDNCEQYIRSVSKEDRIILIVSGRLSREIIPRIFQLRQVSSIYVHDVHKTRNGEWIKEITKVKAVISQLDALVTQIACDQAKRSYKKVDESLSLTVFRTGNIEDRSTTGLNGQFVHTQLLIDCLLRMKSPSTDKHELISLFQIEYEGNSHALAVLREFEIDYSVDRALWWYTRESFLYRVLNKALRVQNIELLFLFRFFIRDIEQQLEQNRCLSSIRVYRSQLMSHEELALLKNSVGQFISVNSFFSTSVSREVALFYITDSIPSVDTQQVLFEIDADPRLDGIKPFANITTHSYFPSEEEVLIMLGSIYRIVDIIHEDEVWIIRMTLCSDNDNDLKPIFEHMKNQYGNGETNLLSFGAVLHDMGKFDAAEKYYRRMLSDLPHNHDLISACYHALGNVALENGDYDSSLDWNLKSLEICMRRSELDRSSLAHSYNSIGVVHQKKGDYKLALESYNKALVIWKQIFGENDPKVAMCLNNMGGVYHTMEKYFEALECHQKALAIWQIHLPADCPDLGASHNNTGSVYGCLGQFDLAMEHYHESLKIYQKSLPSNHPAHAKTLENMGLVYYLKDELQEALSYYRKAATIYRHSLSSTHPKLTKIEEDIRSVSTRKMPSSFHFWWLDTLKVSNVDKSHS